MEKGQGSEVAAQQGSGDNEPIGVFSIDGVTITVEPEPPKPESPKGASEQVVMSGGDASDSDSSAPSSIGRTISSLSASTPGLTPGRNSMDSMDIFKGSGTA